MNPCNPRNIRLFPFTTGALADALAGLLLWQPAAGATQVTWNSSTPGDVWSAPGNWTGGTRAGNEVLFSGPGRTSSSATVGNVVDQSITVSSLTYQSIGSWQVTHINADTTLTLAGTSGGILNVSYTGNAIVQAAIRGGEGTLSINQSDATMQVTGRDLNHGGYYAFLDLSGLARFDAVLDKVTVGAALTAQFYEGRLNLAADNTIQASSLLIGEVGVNTQSSTRQVGSVTLGTANALSIDRIDVGSERGILLIGTNNLGFSESVEDTIAGIRAVGGGVSKTMSRGGDSAARHLSESATAG